MPEDYIFNRRFKRFEQELANGHVFIVCQYQDGWWKSLIGNRVHWVDEVQEIGAYKTLPEAKLAGMKAARQIAYQILEESAQYSFNRYLIWQCLGIAIALQILSYFLLPNTWNF